MLLGLSLETLQAQVQMGSTIYGEDYNELGSSVVISSDGNTMITGSPKDYRGYAQVFEWDGSDWQQIGDTLFGDDFNDRFGDQVSISADGSIIAVGAKFQDENGSGTGQVKIFEWNSSNANWSQKGLDLIGDHSGNNFGAAVKFKFLHGMDLHGIKWGIVCMVQDCKITLVKVYPYLGMEISLQ